MKRTKLADTHPDLVKQWHVTRNADCKPAQVGTFSHKKVWWKCPTGKRDHVWQAAVRVRTAGNGCPYCANKKVCKSNCLSTTHPNLVLEWHKTKNKGLTPDQVIQGTDRKVWWKCQTGKRGHVWFARIRHRAKGNGCPFCAGLKRVQARTPAKLGGRA